jgi:hypothetical protein
MTQQSAGSPSKKQTPGQNFLSQFVAEKIEDLKRERDPSSFQVVANGAQPQTLEANRDYYV